MHDSAQVLRLASETDDSKFKDRAFPTGWPAVADSSNCKKSWHIY